MEQKKRKIWKDAISDVLAEDVDEEVVEEEEIDLAETEDLEEDEVGDMISSVFTERKSPIEMKELFKNLDAEINELDGINFKTTTLDLVYQVNGINFLRIRPRVNRLDILTAPDYYSDIVKITEKNEIDDVMVSIKESYELIKEKRSN